MHRLMITFLGILVSIASSGQSESLNKYIEVQHKRMHFNGVVLVTKNNQQLYCITVGKASHELNVSMKPEAVFKVASISKQFTAMLVALAIQERRVRPEDSLAQFFPQLENSTWRNINVHQLLSHTSGIPHNEGIKDYWLLRSLQPLSKKQALDEIFQMNLLFKPGMDMKYSSPGYFLLACILEIVYQRPYAALFAEKILQPLQLKQTGVYVTGKMVPGMVSAYHLLNDSLIDAPYRDFSMMKGSGDLYSNAEDLAKWNNSFFGDNIWSDSIKKLLFTCHNPKTPFYGYGWFIRPGKRLAYYHGGGTFGCSALSALYPQEKVSVVILSNVSTLPVNELWNDIEKIIFKEPFELPVASQAITMSTTALQAFTGRYMQDQHELQILLIKDQLYAKLDRNPPFEIYPENELKFYGKKVSVNLTFKVDAAGNILSVEAAVRGQVHHFNKK
jgi:CubicO group peptidase (beta-lactamase class C family)